MLTTSAAFKNAIASEDREIRAYLKFNGSTILRGVDGLVSIEWDQSVYDEERLCIGCAVSSFITAEFFDNLTGVDFKNSYVEAFVGVVLEDTGTAPSGSIEPDTATVEYVSLGRFDITDSVTKNGKTVITAYDKLSKLSGEYTPSISAGANGYAIKDIVNDVLTQSGVGGSVSGDYGYVQKIQASTYREQLKYCLTMMVQNGSSYILGRTNDSLKMTSVIGQDATQLTITDSTTYMDGMDEQPSFTISSLQATTGTDVYTFGNGQGIEISNPYITNAQASAIYNSMEGFSYLPIRLEFRGNPAIDPGDVLTLTAGGKNTKIVAMRIRSTFNGGFKSTIDCYGNTETYYAMSESPTGTRITQAENMIRLEAARATAAEGSLSSQITINAESIQSEVSRATAAEGALSTSISQTAGQVSIVAQKLNNIGGRNIIRGTGSPTLGSGAWSSGTIRASGSTAGTSLQIVDITDSPVAGITKAIGLTASASETAPGFAQDAYSMVGHVGQKITYSAWVKGQAGDQVILQAWYLDNTFRSSKSFTLTGTEWTRLSYTTDAITRDATNISIGYIYYTPATVGSTLYVIGQKEEFGEVPTSWTPAPEDAEAAIAANSAAIQVNATNIASKVSQTDYNGDTIASLINQTSTSVQIQASKVDLQGYVTFTNLSTSGQTAINGANITTGSITASKINLTDLFSQNITATNFNLMGGSINIQTSAQDTNSIELNWANGAHTEQIQLSPSSFYFNSRSGTYGDFSYSMRSFFGSLGIYGTRTAGGTRYPLFQYSSILGSLDLSGLDTPGELRLIRNGTQGSATADWAATLETSGLTFRDTSGNVTASYPATGWETNASAGVSEQIGTDWTLTNNTVTLTQSGIYIIYAALDYYNSPPRGLMIAFDDNTYYWPLAVTEISSGSVGGRTISRIYASFCGYLSSGYKIELFAKSLNAASNLAKMYVHGPIA